MISVQQQDDFGGPPRPVDQTTPGGKRPRSQRLAKAVIVASLLALAVATFAAATGGAGVDGLGTTPSDDDNDSPLAAASFPTSPADAEGTTAAADAEGTAASAADESAVANDQPPVELDDALVAGFARAEFDVEAAMAENLAIITGASIRNRNHDDSPHAATPQDDLVVENHYGPRSDYLNQPYGNPENSFPVVRGGQFRAACEFSHFAYDDPLVYPAKPGASHLHMFFGNTQANAFTTYESLINTGSSTCNGQELNRTGYWAPAVFDGNGNVRIPERIVVYYKGENKARGRSEVYPPRAAMIATENINAMPSADGGAGGVRPGFLCTDNFSANTNIGSQTMANCDGSRFGTDPDGPRWTVLEVSIKFPQCWNGDDPSDWTNFSPPVGDWYVSRCEGDYNHTFPNLEYFINYRVEPGENTAGWFLASDVDPVSFSLGDDPAGSTIHADWWGGWHPDVNQLWIDNCVNYVHPDGIPSGCGRGYLTDGGPDANNPHDGPALKIRPQYTGPLTVPAATLYEELCPDPMRPYTRSEDAAYCHPGSGHAAMGHGDMELGPELGR